MAPWLPARAPRGLKLGSVIAKYPNEVRGRQAIIRRANLVPRTYLLSSSCGSPDLGRRGEEAVQQAKALPFAAGR